jgi:hypothetical protein
MMTRILLLFFALALWHAAAFAQRSTVPPPPPPVPQPTPDLGLLTGTNYTNAFFGMSVSVPGDWVVLTARRNSEIAEEAKKMIQADSETKQNQIDASINRSLTLLAMNRLPAGQPHNANFMLIAERPPSLAFKTGNDVINSMKTLGQGTNLTLEFQGEVVTKQIGGAEFAVATVKNSSTYGTFMQKIYVAMRKGYAIEFFFTYQDEDIVPTFDSIVNTVRFK